MKVQEEYNKKIERENIARRIRAGLRTKILNAMVAGYKEKSDAEHDLKEDARYQEIVRHIRKESALAQFRTIFAGAIINSNIFLACCWLSSDLSAKVFSIILALFWTLFAFWIVTLERKLWYD